MITHHPSPIFQYQSDSTEELQSDTEASAQPCNIVLTRTAIKMLNLEISGTLPHEICQATHSSSSEYN